MSSPDIHHLAAAYALDAVDDLERQAFEAHFHACAVCRADVFDHRETLAALAVAGPVAPSPATRDRILAEIAQTRQLSPLLGPSVSALVERRRRRRRTGATLLTAAAVLLVIVGSFLVTRETRPSFADELAEVLEQPDGRLLTLTPTEANDGQGAIRVVWSASSGRVALLGDALDPALEGMAYELWLIDETGPVPLNLLDPAEGGILRTLFGLDREPVAWGVTLEPATGSPTPTGDILFLAET